MKLSGENGCPTTAYSAGTKRANDLRYSTHRCWLSQVQLAPGAKPTWAWGVVAYQNLSESVQPIVDQALVKIEWALTFHATFVREIGYPLNYQKFGTPSFPSLFKVGGKLFLTLMDGTYLADSNGAIGKVEQPADKNEVSIGQICRDYVMFFNEKNMNLRIWSPSKANKNFPIKPDVFNNWPGPIQLSADSFLFSNGATVVNPTTGKSIALPVSLPTSRPYILWGNYAVPWDGKVAKIFDGETGRLVGSAKRHFRR